MQAGRGQARRRADADGSGDAVDELVEPLALGEDGGAAGLLGVLDLRR
jgi:hypothetical protein